MVVGILILFKLGIIFLLDIVKPRNKAFFLSDQKNNEDDQIIFFASFASLIVKLHCSLPDETPRSLSKFLRFC